MIQGWTLISIQKYFYFLFLFLLLSACLDNSQRVQNRPTVANFGNNTEENISPTPKASGSASTSLRPTNQVYISNEFCICAEKKPEIHNNCAVFCSSKDTKNPTLFVSTTVGPDIALNPKLGNLYNWCKKELGDGKTNPSCQLEAWDGSDKFYIDITINLNSNAFTADATQLEKNKTYILTLMETGTGSMSKSRSFQIRRIDPPEDEEVELGTLKISPVNQFFCVNRTFTSADAQNGTTNEFYLKAVKRHFYFIDSNVPPALPPGDNSIFCHDIVRYGNTDGPLFPRLGLKENVLYVWNPNDLRFFDQDANNSIDVNDLISKRLAKEFNITQTNSWFFDFRYFNSPAASGDNVPLLGYLMQPWIDPKTLMAFCPKQSQYLSQTPVFRILKDIVGVDTEGLFFAVKEPETFTDNSGRTIAAPADYLLVRESYLKKIWFYLDNGLHVTPNELTSTQKTIMFYWPADTAYPYIKKSTQQVFIVKHPSQVGEIGNQTGVRNSVLPPDRRFACIPAFERQK